MLQIVVNHIQIPQTAVGDSDQFAVGVFIGNLRIFPERHGLRISDYGKLADSRLTAGAVTFRILWSYAVRKMTFSVPEPLASQFLRRVASRDRSRFVSEALAARLEKRDLDLILACEAANSDLEVAEIEKDLDGICDRMAEPWK